MKINENQTKRLLDYLIKNQTIQPLQAWQELGIYRLSAVIFVLRKEGHNISKEFVLIKNRYGEDCRFAEHRLNLPGVV